MSTRTAATREGADALDRIDDALDRILAATDHLDQPRQQETHNDRDAPRRRPLAR